MPTYEELVRLLRNLIKATHQTLGQEELTLTRETGGLMIALKESQDALLKLDQPTPAPQPDDASVIHLYGSGSTTTD